MAHGVLFFITSDNAESNGFRLLLVGSSVCLSVNRTIIKSFLHGFRTVSSFLLVFSLSLLVRCMQYIRYMVPVGF